MSITSRAFSRMASVTASTKRSPAAAGGKIGVKTTNLASLAILPLMPVTSEVIEYYRLQSPRESYMTYAQGAPDIIEGDTLTVSAVDYPVIAVQPWPTDTNYLEIIVQRVKAV